jgi:ACS family hexuronate transporter-like MFS transporter
MTPTVRSASWRWWVCGALLLATFLNYMDRQALAVTLPALKQRFHIAERRVGMLEGSFGFAFAFGSILFGYLADRYGPRRLYPAVLTGWSLAGIATALAGQPYVTNWLEQPGDDPGTGTFRWLLLCRILLGVCEAGHWPCALITARQILTAKDRPLGNAILQSGASLGAILVPLYVEITERLGHGWEFVFWSIGVTGLLWVPLWMSLIRRGDLDGPPPPEASSPSALSGKGLVRQLVMLTIIVSCLNVSWQFLRAWLPLFLQDFHGYSPQSTRFITSAYFISTDVGCILAGLLVRRLVSHGLTVDLARRIGFASFTALTALAALVPLVNAGPVMIAFLLLAGAGILGLHPYYYAFAQELPVQRMGLLSGALAAVGWMTSSVFQIFIGSEIQSAGSYDLGLVIVGLAPMIGLVALLVLAGSRRGANHTRQ